jgi:hypothetical protein
MRPSSRLATRDIPPSVKSLVNILNFRLTPSLVSGVAPIQSLSPGERAVISQLKQYTLDELRQVIVYLTNGNDTYRVFQIVTYPNSPNRALLTRIYEDIFRNGLSDVLMYGAFHEMFAWIAASAIDIDFFATSFFLLNNFVTHADPLELSVVAELLIDAYLHQPNFEMSSALLGAIHSHVMSNPNLPASFSHVFRSFAVHALQSPVHTTFLRSCEDLAIAKRPFLILTDDDAFTELITPYVKDLDEIAIEFLCLVGSLAIPVSTSTRDCFEALPMAIYRLVSSVEPKHQFFEKDLDALLTFVAPSLHCEFEVESRMVFNSSVVCPQELVETTHVEFEAVLPAIYLEHSISHLPVCLAKVQRRYLEIVFLTFVDWLTNSTDSKYYFDMFAIFEVRNF